MKNNNDTLEAMEADVGCEKTHYQNQKLDPEMWERELLR